MSNSFTTNIIINHLDTDTTFVTRLINQIVSSTPTNYGSGIYKLNPTNQLDYFILSGKSFIFFKASSNVIYRLGGVDGEEFIGNMCLHNGNPIDLYITNTDDNTEMVTIEYAYMDT